MLTSFQRHDIYDMRHTLEIQPLLCQPRLIAVGLKAQSALRVVLLDQVFDDGARFPEGKVGVGVVDGGHATIGVDSGELGTLNIGEADFFDLVGKAELLDQHAHFCRIGSSSAVENDWFDGCHV